MTLEWKKTLAILLAMFVLATRELLVALAPASLTGHTLEMAFWVLLGLPLLLATTLGVCRHHQTAEAQSSQDAETPNTLITE